MTLLEPSKREVAELYERYGTMVHRRALSILGNRSDAEDATQEIFVRVLKSLDQHQGKSSLTAWIYRITTNHCLNTLRNQQKRRQLMDHHWLGDRTERASGGPSALELVSLRHLLAQAEPREALVAVYVWIDGMNRQEAAVALGVSERTVYNLLRRFSCWAQALLEEEKAAFDVGASRDLPLQGSNCAELLK